MTTPIAPQENWIGGEETTVASLVSVIIPNYNHAAYLPQAIDSVLRQTYQPFEIIVVDDGSTDDSRQVADAYGNQIRYIWQMNQGLSAARNTGLRSRYDIPVRARNPDYTHGYGFDTVERGVCHAGRGGVIRPGRGPTGGNRIPGELFRIGKRDCRSSGAVAGLFDCRFILAVDRGHTAANERQAGRIHHFPGSGRRCAGRIIRCSRLCHVDCRRCAGNAHEH